MTEAELKVIITAEIDKLKEELQEAQKEVDKVGKTGKKGFKAFEEGVKKAADVTKKAFAVVGAAIVGAGAALLAIEDSTREYRQEQAKLEATFINVGSSAEQAKKTYNDLYRVLGDTGQAVEAAQHLAQLTTNEEDLYYWTATLQGVYATFGASLPIESLTEAANETAKTGQLTGALADALNWVGVSEEAFQAQLDACNTEQERATLILDTLNGYYAEAAGAYEETAAALLAYNEAQARQTAAMAKIGEAITPVKTALAEFVAIIAEQVAPIIQELVAEHGATLTAFLQDLAVKIGEVIAWIVDNWELISTIAAIIAGVGVAILAVNAAITAYNAVMAIANALMSPVTLIILAIVAAIALCIIYWDDIKAAALSAWEWIKNAWNNAGTWFSGIVSKIKNAFAGIGAWFKNIFSTAWNGIKSIWSGVSSFFTGVWDSIKSIFSNVGTAIASGIQGAVSSAVNAVLGTGARIINGFIDAINVAIGIINAIPGVNIGYLSKLSVPAMAKGGVVDGATLAQIGEDGAEAVVPLENNLEWLDKLATMLNERMGGNQPIVLNVDGKRFAEISVDSINSLTRQRGSIPLVIA